MKIKYIEKNFNPATIATMDQANDIITEYASGGFSLTLRQLYYQFVARGLFANEQRQYKRLGEIISNGRLAGLVDWQAIEDRTRNLKDVSTWSSPASIIQACVSSYKEDKWAVQPYYIEVWVEKEALAGVMERACNDLDIPFFACRGYVSQSEMWNAADRLKWKGRGKKVVILHFGDHDPSGIDMTRDNSDRMSLFGALPTGLDEVKRIALNMDQIEHYQPPPDPAKVTDSRYMAYRQVYGENSWELDALDPATLIALVRNNVLKYRNESLWKDSLAKEEDGRDYLKEVQEQWNANHTD